MGLTDIVGIVSRWLHITSAIALLGGVIFARATGNSGLFAQYRTVVMAAALGSFASGIYNLLTKVNTPKPYHMMFGIKFLLALHVLAVGWMATRASVSEEKRLRWLTGILASGLAVTLISAYLRWLSR
jgi:hypothetical protein